MPQHSAIARQWNFNQPVVSLAVNRNGDWIAAAMGDGSLRVLPATAAVAVATAQAGAEQSRQNKDSAVAVATAQAGAEQSRQKYEAAGQPKEIKLHNGVSLSLQPDADGHAFLSGGDDGKVFIIDPTLDAPTQIAEHKNKWVDHVAGSIEGFRAYSVGKEVFLLNEEGETIATHTLLSSAGGLCFSPNGKRLAASHYNGVSLFWANAKDSAAAKLPWKGSHLGVIWTPDGKILLTSLQENALHGWRLSDMNEMRMQGYAAKIHSMSFTPKGKYLATSGADQVICWPFFGGGPWGKQPLTLGGNTGRLVSHVAAHPKDEMVAAGYDDGMIILAPLDGRMEVMIHPPTPYGLRRDKPQDASKLRSSEDGPPVAEKGTAVTGLVWNREGDCLFAALENGYAMLFTIDSVKKAVTNA